MTIVVGLGNPGEKFKGTRHNIGFEVVEKFAEKNNFPDFELLKKHGALLSEKSVSGEKVTLVKPQTFMNNSGLAIKKLGKINLDYLIVVHDDVDLPLGKLKIVKDRGSAGHKGLESIIKNMGSKNFIRIRIGIQEKSGKLKNREKFVIGKFSANEKPIIRKSIEKASEALSFLLENGLEKGMNKYNSNV